MKTLYVLRHAKSDWGEAVPDFDRPLNQRGRKAAKAIGGEMKERGIIPDLVISSPAVRARETIERVLEAFGEEVGLTGDHRIYEASTATLMDVVRGAPEEVERLMIVGHNPGFHDLVIRLTEPSALREEAEQKFPTAALAEIRFDVVRWEEIAPGNGRLEDLIKPRDL